MKQKLTDRHFSGAQKLWIGIAAVSLAAVAAGIALWWLKTEFFENNERFTLREVHISRPDGFNRTYWTAEKHHGKRVLELEEILQFQIGVSNLFALDLAQMRKQLLAAHPEISRAVIRRGLPDQLHFEIYERLPVASIGYGADTNTAAERFNRYVDEEGAVFSSAYCEPVQLPAIIEMTGEKTETGMAVPGDTVTAESMRLAIDFICLLNRAYPELAPRTVVLVEKQHLIQTEIRYRNNYYTVILPYPVTGDKLRNDLMGRLIPALKAQHRKNDSRSFIDLRYENQAVVRPR